ncbi:MAG TPA: aminotransferase class I/II-fold pyridoxal phosphate-dependent enzyme, partial [bacterium]|nr:aminotransferase class I/II-fold pyridoxal phosphate-dependent enzyme [bacterium]
MSDFKVAPASAMSRLGTETAFEVLVKAKALEAQGKHIVHLEIGEPDFDTPTNISEAAIKALREGWTHYGPSPGLPDLRKAIADYVSKTRHIETHPDEVVVTPGGKPIIFFPIMALIDPGDEVIYPNPGFPIYESMINFVGGKAVPLHISEEKNFTFDVSELKEKISQKTKLVIINSPANPTGGVFSKKDIEDIAAIVKQYNCYVMSDEIYSRIMYGYEHYSIASLPGMKERTIILDGFSKT